MEIEVLLTYNPIPRPPPWPPLGDGRTGSVVEFHGIVRDTEDGKPISALRYEAYEKMALRVMRARLEALAEVHPCRIARVLHRLGIVPVGEAAIYVQVGSLHRADGFRMLAAFMDELKKDVPIWKAEALPR